MTTKDGGVNRGSERGESDEGGRDDHSKGV
jgi:hypothetical protein